MSRTSRLARYRRERRLQRRPLVLAVLGLSVMLVAIMAALVSSAADVQADSPMRVADYNTLGRWPGTDPTVCLEDHTGGFPVGAAAGEFAGVFEFVVADECTEHEHVVTVVTINDPGMSNSAWFDAEWARPGVYESGEIRLNVAQGFRMDPTGWRAVLVHELGHAAGLAHTYEGESIMHPLLYAERHLTEVDLAQIAELYRREVTDK